LFSERERETFAYNRVEAPAHTLYYGRSAYDLHGVRARDPNIGIFSPSLRYTLDVCALACVCVCVCVLPVVWGGQNIICIARLRRRWLEYIKNKTITNYKQTKNNHSTLYYSVYCGRQTLLRVSIYTYLFINRYNNKNIIFYYSSPNVHSERFTSKSWLPQYRYNYILLNIT